MHPPRMLSIMTPVKHGSLVVLLALTFSPSCSAIDLSFDDPSFFLGSLTWQSTGSPVALVDAGVSGSKGIEPAIWRPDRTWSRVIYREETFDTGIPCCGGDPVIPLSVMFRYRTPELNPEVQLTSPFAGLVVSTSTTSGPSLRAELGWHQDAVGDPLEYYISGSSTAGSGAAQIEFLGDLQLTDNHWYRLATSFGESSSGNRFDIRLEDFGEAGSDFVSAIASTTIITSGAKFGINDSYAGFYGSIREGGGAMVFDEFHDTLGDFNADGTVDSADYTLWRDTLGTRDTQTNHSGDHIVDAVDYQIWRANFGRTALPQAVASTLSGVPEPNGAVLLLSVLQLLAITRRC